MNKEPIQKEVERSGFELDNGTNGFENANTYTTTPSDTFIEEIAKEAHIKWLSKSKTVKIDGQELTVLPYGYLGQAVKSSLQEQRQSILEEIEKKKTDERKVYYFGKEPNCYGAETYQEKMLVNAVLEDIKQLLKDNKE